MPVHCLRQHAVLVLVWSMPVWRCRLNSDCRNMGTVALQHMGGDGAFAAGSSSDSSPYSTASCSGCSEGEAGAVCVCVCVCVCGGGEGGGGGGVIHAGNKLKEKTHIPREAFRWLAEVDGAR